MIAVLAFGKKRKKENRCLQADMHCSVTRYSELNMQSFRFIGNG